MKLNSIDKNEQIKPIDLVGIVCWVAWIFFLGDKPIHLDETNFLMLTQGDWRQPHNVMVNWEGSLEPAFDVLSNPPGMAWVLWAFKDLSPLWMRLAVLPWALLSLWSVFSLGRHFGVGRSSVLIFAVSPFFGLTHNTLMPDMILFSLIAWGWQGVLSERNLLFWCFVIGLSSIFRYSGLTMIPLLWCWLLVYRPKRSGLCALVVSLPTLLLMLYDVQVYGHWHFWHMISFQQEQGSLVSMVHKMGAFSAMLGGGFSLIFSPKKLVLMGSLMWAMVLLVCFHFLSVDWSAWSIFWVWYGGAVGVFGIHHWLQSRHVFVLWILGSIVFLLSLRFSATRYWGPFIVPFVIASATVLANMRWSIAWVLLWGVITSHLVWDDRMLAESQKILVSKSVDLCPDKGVFSGHWGWQYYLETEGWEPINDGQKLPNNVCYVLSVRSWPQEVSSECWELEVENTQRFTSRLLPLRVHSVEAGSNYHSFYISDRPAIQTMPPWGFGSDPWDTAYFKRSCRF